MTVSFLLRLVEEALRTGHVAGQVEEVESGRTGVFRDVSELVAFMSTECALGADGGGNDARA